MKKTLVLALFCGAILFFLGRELNPFNLRFFTVHDNTQVARLSEFAFNLKSGIIPPRIAPHFSFNYGIPVFNFYAPFSAWIGGILSLIMSPAIVLKILALCGLLVGFISMFLLVSSLFSFWPGILSATVYSSSLWMAVEIFIRGNVGEIWFMALFPLALFFISYPHKKISVWFYILGSLTIAATLTVHNVLSLISLIIFVGALFVIKEKKRVITMLLCGLLLSSSFLIPALLENNLTYASDIASKTKYTDHFLCTWQLWKAMKWSYGGSGIGCLNDDMSFQVGKPHIMLGVLGMIIFLYEFFKKRKIQNVLVSFFILAIGVFSAFLTLSYSKPIWDLLSPVMKVFQFPWRFLSFLLFSLSFFSAYVFSQIKIVKFQVIGVTICSLALLFLSGKFFTNPWQYSLGEYSEMFLTGKYIEKKAAYEIPEYFPRTGSYQAWRAAEKYGLDSNMDNILTLVNRPFYKQYKMMNETVVIPLHYFPVWNMQIGTMSITPTQFDTLGRPQIKAPIGSIITVTYRETPIETGANVLSGIGFIFLFLLVINKKIWKKLNHINN